MEALDRVLAREEQKLRPSDVKAAEVHSVADIRRLVAELDPKRNPPQTDIPMSSLLNANEDNKNVTYRVNTHTRSKSRRDMLVEGLLIIKNRLDLSDRMASAEEPVEVNGVEMRPTPLGDGVQGSSWVDPLIGHWLGGSRDGIIIKWDLADGFTYRYDIFAHRLSRVERTNG